jgi:hypothetical protein
MFQYWRNYIQQLKDRNKNVPKRSQVDHPSEQTPPVSAIDEKEAELQRQALHQPAFTQETDADVDLMFELTKSLESAEIQDISTEADDSDKKNKRSWSTVMTAD